MIIGISISLAVLTVAWIGWNLSLDALWQPTDRVTVRRILFFADVKPGERVVDLGCGDGRIVITAARLFDAQGIGVEIDPARVLWARTWALLAGVKDRVRIVWKDMYKVDLHGADVVVLFLSPVANFKLQDKLRRELHPGARIVSYYHPIWGWEPEEIRAAKTGYSLFLYRIQGNREIEALDH
jgi:SAM-dependent methyltransferase